MVMTAGAVLLLTGCGDNEVDIHAIERETKAYESASVQMMDTKELITHLQGLTDEMTLATQTKQYAEMHHLEIALTKALHALEAKGPANLTQIIQTLKIIAAKIHGVGHDQNESMAATLDKTLRDHMVQLKEAFESASRS